MTSVRGDALLGFKCPELDKVLLVWLRERGAGWSRTQLFGVGVLTLPFVLHDLRPPFPGPQLSHVQNGKCFFRRCLLLKVNLMMK